MYYDLNVPYVANQAELQRTLAFLADLGYKTIALDHTINGKVPSEILNEIPNPLPFNIPPSLRILRRCTLHISDPSQNHRLSSLSAAYDIFVVRPANEPSLQQACQSLDCDLVSLDLSQRFPFYFKNKTFSAALQRGVKFEICYAPGILNSDGGASRRNLISNATQMIRVTRGRGIVISSEAKRALACRGPADVVNLAVMWGLPQERGAEAIDREARSVVVQSEMKRRSFRGVIDVVYGGEVPARPAGPERQPHGGQVKAKRKAEVLENGAGEAVKSPKPISKREQKRQAKRARLENIEAAEDEATPELKVTAVAGGKDGAAKPMADSEPA